MARPQHGTGKTTDWREDLNAFRRNDPEKFAAMVAEAKQFYETKGSVAETAKALKIGKRTFERAMSDIPELRSAIDSARVSYGR